MQARMLICTVATAALVSFLAPAAYSADSGGGGGNTVNQCRDGKVWDKRLKKCVTPKHGQLDDESIYEAGSDLAYAERYGEAITLLSLAADKSDPRILNLLGYSHRKQGRVQVGLGYYHEALRADPDFTLAREYLGEAHLQLGDVQSAREQLSEIEKRCGRTCEEYRGLAAKIDTFEKG